MWEPGALVATPASTFTADHEGLLFALIEPGGYLSSPPPQQNQNILSVIWEEPGGGSEKSLCMCLLTFVGCLVV